MTRYDAPVEPDETSQALGQRRFGKVNWLGLRTLYVREVRRFLKVLMQTVLAPVVTTMLYMVVFLQAFGRTDTVINGISYPLFLAPGLIMLAIMTNAFANSSSSIMTGKLQGSIVDILMPPLSSAELVVGFVAGAVTRGLLVGVITAITCAIFTGLAGEGLTVKMPFVIAYFSVMTAVLFSTLGVAAGIWADKFDQMAMINNFIIMPLTFLSGTFYAISNLPEPFLTISHFNPVFYMIDGLRYGFTGQAEADIVIGGAVLLVANIVLGVWVYWLMRSGYKLKS